MEKKGNHSTDPTITKIALENLYLQDEICLSRLFSEALDNENYEVCSMIKNEISDRIKKNKINKYMVRLLIKNNGTKMFNGLFAEVSL